MRTLFLIAVGLTISACSLYYGDHGTSRQNGPDAGHFFPDAAVDFDGGHDPLPDAAVHCGSDGGLYPDGGIIWPDAALWPDGGYPDAAVSHDAH